MSGDPYREEVELLRERLRELRQKHGELLARIRSDSFSLEQRFQSARVAERGKTKSNVQSFLPLVVAAMAALALAVECIRLLFDEYAILILIPACIIGPLVLIRWMSKPNEPRTFDPTRYELETAPAHLLAARKWLDRDRDEADELAQEIREADEFLAAQEKHDSELPITRSDR